MRLLTDDVKIQRLALFNAIEAGNTYWARQVNEFGIAMVYEHLALGVYDATKYGAITQRIFQLIQQIGVDLLFAMHYVFNAVHQPGTGLFDPLLQPVQQAAAALA